LDLPLMFGEAASVHPLCGRGGRLSVGVWLRGVYHSVLIQRSDCFLVPVEKSLAARPYFDVVQFLLIPAVRKLRNYLFELREAFLVI
jgi:hypothetical protein